MIMAGSSGGSDNDCRVTLEVECLQTAACFLHHDHFLHRLRFIIFVLIEKFVRS